MGLVHMSWKELRHHEAKLEWLATVSCSAQALGIDENNTARLRVLDLQEGWDKRYKNKLRTTFTIWMDCRVFDGAIGVQGHTGEHTDSILTMADHHKLRAWLEQFKDEYTYCLRDVRHRESMKVVCFCDGGEWTSVACARILAYLICPAYDPYHMQNFEWRDQKICWGDCEQCEPENELKEECLEVIEHLWASLFSLTNQLKQRVPLVQRVSASIIEPAQRVVPWHDLPPLHW